MSLEGAKESAATSADSHGLRWLLYGPAGLRAGWRLLIFAAILLLLFRVNSLIKSALRVTDEVVLYLIVEVLSFVSLLLASWIMSRFEGRRIADYGLPWRRMFRKQFWQGILIGFAAITGIVVAMRAVGVFHFGSVALNRAAIFEFGGLYAVAFLIIGLKEEYYYRGYALFTATTGIGFWPVAAISSVYFGITHLFNAGMTLFGAVNISLGGLLLCLLLRRTGNLWMAIGCHTSLNWAEAFFYGTPVSGHTVPGHLLNSNVSGPAWLTGGAVGPEGSFFCTLVLIVLFVGIARWLREAKYPQQAPIIRT